MTNLLRRGLFPLLICALPLVTIGCSINVDKNENGGEKKVKIDTPLGGIHVNTNKAGGSTGIALYPGAIPLADHDGDKDADVSLGFGAWKLHVQVEHYSTPDDSAKVVAYYHKALAKYGDVLTCQGAHPVGMPAKTAEGLTCEATDKSVHIEENSKGLTLRTGSRRRQHMVAFDKEASASSAGPTSFVLIALDLPSESWKKDRETD